MKMKLPTNTNLPFFAYGIFKPGQLCFSRISDLVDKTTASCVNGSLKERDGIPLLVENTSLKIKGHLIYFRSGNEKEAYERIIDIEPRKIYFWKEIKCDNEIEANVLFGKKSNRGSSDLEHVEEWDGKSDPFFKVGLEEVEAILEENDNPNPGLESRALLRLQMAYTLLWSSIERYAGLKYYLGKSDIMDNKIAKIAEEKCFADSLKKNVKRRTEIYDAADLNKCTLDPNDPVKSIKYYYQVRSNAVHRGKGVNRDFDTIKKSLEELLTIFKEMIDEAFKE